MEEEASHPQQTAMGQAPPRLQLGEVNPRWAAGGAHDY